MPNARRSQMGLDAQASVPVQFMRATAISVNNGQSPAGDGKVGNAVIPSMAVSKAFRYPVPKYPGLSPDECL